MLSVLKHILAHHVCRHQGVFVLVFITLYNGLLYDSGPFNSANDNYEDSLMMACVVC
jgi:hypothetical protein